MGFLESPAYAVVFFCTVLCFHNLKSQIELVWGRVQTEVFLLFLSLSWQISTSLNKVAASFHILMSWTAFKWDNSYVKFLGGWDVVGHAEMGLFCFCRCSTICIIRLAVITTCIESGRHVHELSSGAIPTSISRPLKIWQCYCIGFAPPVLGFSWAFWVFWQSGVNLE